MDNQRKLQEQMADLEFTADMQEALDPISRLGFDVSTSKYAKNPDADMSAAYIREDAAAGREKGKPAVAQSAKYGADLKYGDVVLSPGMAASKDVWAHEYRHRGLKRIMESYSKDPEGFKQRYGDQAVFLLSSAAKDKGADESVTEFFDRNLGEEWATGRLGKDAKYTMGQTRDTAGQTEGAREKYQKGIQGLLKAASDMITQEKGYAKGGTVEKEMESAFKDDGAEIDPKSGNEVPPGSLSNEVSDDVDAKLSEGEYVVPANVVRFLGLDKLEKMVQKAQAQLSDMEDKGRIGGEPVDDQEDELPFDISELEVEDEEPIKMAEGGAVAGVSGAEALGIGGGSMGFDTRIYVNEAGQQRSIMFIDGTPIQQIPPGFKPKAQVQQAQRQGMDAETAKGIEDLFKSGQGSEVDPFSDVEKESKWNDPTEWGAEDFKGFADRTESMNKITKGVSAIAGPVGLAMGLGRKHRGNKAYDELVSRLEDPNLSPEDKAFYEEQKAKYEDLGLDEGINVPGSGILDQIKDWLDPPAPVPETPSAAKEQYKSTTQAQPQAAAPAGTPAERGSNDNGWGGADDYDSGAVEQSGVATGTSADTDVGATSDRGGGIGSQGYSGSDPGGSADPSEVGGDHYRKGGFVSKQTKKKRRGLANRKK